MTEVFLPTSVPSSGVLSTLEEAKLWSSEDHVQSWIDNLTENEIITRGSETSEVTSPTKTSFDDLFLLLPNTDELALGAEAKHYGYCGIISPRLSPLIGNDGIDSQELEMLDESLLQDKNDISPIPSPPLPEEKPQMLNERKDLEKLLAQRSSTDKANETDDEMKLSATEKRKLTYQTSTCSSWASSFDKPSSLAAALFTDPEELLYSLGFCEDLSVWNVIPSRFFLEPSQAFGIDVQEIQQTLLMENEEQSFYSHDSSRPAFHRFSESSIDLSYTSSDSLRASSRRILYKSHRNDIPSIHLSQEEDRPFSPLSSTATSCSNAKRLETLEEVPEPNSRTSSFESDPSTAQAISAFIAASKNSLQNALDQVPSFFSRKLSCGSRGDTLTDSLNDFDENIQHKNHTESNKTNEMLERSITKEPDTLLRMPLLVKRSNSDKSISSSIVTVINNSHEKQQKLDHSDLNEKSLGQSHPNLFKPIVVTKNETVLENESIEDNSNLNNSETKPKRTSSELRRSRFKTAKSHNVELSDSVFESSDGCEDCNKNISLEQSNFTKKELSITSNKFDLSSTITDPSNVLLTDINPELCYFISEQTLSTEPKKTVNQSFHDFFINLKGDINSKSIKVVKEDPCTQVIITPAATTAFDENLILPCGEEGEIDGINETEEESNTTSKKKKNVFYTAINSLSNVFLKNQDFKQSLDKDTHTFIQPKQKNASIFIAPTESDDNDNNNNINSNKPLKTFNHPTFSSHSNSAFSAIASGVEKDKQLDLEDRLWAQQLGNNIVNKIESPVHKKRLDSNEKRRLKLYNQSFNDEKNRDLEHNSEKNDATKDNNPPSKTDEINLQKQSDYPIYFTHPSTDEVITVSDSSIDFNSSPMGYVADSTSTDDCHCPQDNAKRRRSNSKRLSKGRSIESSGFDDEQLVVKCPLDKNSTLRHTKHSHSKATSGKTECQVCSRTASTSKNHDENIDEQQSSVSFAFSSNSSMTMTHEHFDYLVQQFTALRKEMKNEFKRLENRENHLEITLKEKMYETKKTIEREYMCWISKEMNGLKEKLKEKDDEIKRLRDLINERTSNVTDKLRIS